MAPDYGAGPCAVLSPSLWSGGNGWLWWGGTALESPACSRLALGEEIPHTGLFSLASGLVVSYVPQDASFLRGSLSQFARRSELDETQFKTILRKLDFARVQFEKDLSDYSAGQKKKVLLARSLCQSAHLYVWDEPLNYIDVFSRMQLEELLRVCRPAMLLVEHDQAFLEGLADKRVELVPAWNDRRTANCGSSVFCSRPLTTPFYCGRIQLHSIAIEQHRKELTDGT